MLFLSPLLLWFLARGRACPITIHLINRRRHKTIQWAAMQFLLKAIARVARQEEAPPHPHPHLPRAGHRRARPRRRPAHRFRPHRLGRRLDRHRGAAARPLRLDGNQTRRRPRSAPPDRHRRKSATPWPISAPRASCSSTAPAAKPQEIPSPDVLDRLSATAATDTAADFPALLGRAAEFLTDTPGRSEVWLASDLQASNWRPDDERWAAARASLAALPQKPAVRVLSLTGPTAANSSVRLLGSRRSGDELLLDLEILRSGDARGTSSLPLTTHLNGSRTTENLTLPGQSLRFQKRITLPPDSETGHGWLSIPADGNPRDNAAFFAYGPARPAKSLIVAPPGESADYLALAAAPPGFGNFEARRASIPPRPPPRSLRISPPSCGPRRCPPAPPPMPCSASSPPAAMCFSCRPAHRPTPLSMISSWSDPAEAPAGKFFILDDWNHSDGPLRDGIDGTPVAANRLKAIRRQIPHRRRHAARPLGGWRTRAHPPDCRSRHRVVSRHRCRITPGPISAMPMSCCPPSSASSPPAPTASMPRYLATVGSPAARLLPGETRTRLDDYGSPDPANTEYEAGIHRLGERLLAVNRPPQEDAPGNPHPRGARLRARRHRLHPARPSRPSHRPQPLPRRLARLPHRHALLPPLRSPALPAEEIPPRGPARKKPPPESFSSLKLITTNF